MGSGCNNNYKNNSCTDIVSTDCVKWEGEPYSDFNICVNDSLTEVTTFILNKIKDILIGKGILLPSLTFNDCLFLKDLLGTEEKNLISVIQTYKKAICDLNEKLEVLNLSVEDFTDLDNYALGCINLPTNTSCDPTVKFKNLIQAIISKICSLDTNYNSIVGSISNVVQDITGNFLHTAIKSCGGNGIVVAGLGVNSSITFQALVPPYSPIIYTGSLALFSTTGVGLANTSVCGWYLCNGNNNTPNSSSLPQNTASNLKYIIRFN